MKTLLVTGASSGIGRALAVRAARAGYAVYAVGRNPNALEALRVRIAAENGFIAVDATDIAVAANAGPLVARALERFGSIDVLVNNAGFVSAGSIATQSDAELQRQFGTHVLGPLALVREALAALRRTGGHVFMLGSGVARVPVGGFGAYPPAKAAIRSATAILRRELRPVGIAVTYVDPGAVDTPFMQRGGMPGAPPSVLVSPEEVARKILLAVAKRPSTLNVVAWQTALVALAEGLPRLTDLLLERMPALVGGAAATLPAGEAALAGEQPAPASGTTPEPIAPVSAAPAAPPQPAVDIDAPDRADAEVPTFESALEPHQRRMEKLHFRAAFVRELLVAGAILDLGEIALRWAGMPNKHERAITEEVLEALADAGFLARTADHAYRVPPNALSGLETTVITVIALLGAALVVSVVAEHIGVPYVVALLVVSTPLDTPAALQFAPVLLFVFLPALIFEAAWNIDATRLRKHRLVVTVLAVPGVLITAGLVGAGLALTGQMPFLPALLLGAILAATDPIAVIAVFRRLHVPADLETIVEGESLFNDGAAIVLYGVVVSILNGGHVPDAREIGWTAVSVSLGGAAIGFACAALVAIILRGTRAVQLQVVATIVAAFGAYLIADELHLSGIFATVVAGIALRAFPRFPTPQALVDVNGFWSVMAFLANAFVFVLMGLRLEFGRIVHEPVLVLLTLALVTAARLVLAFIALPLTGARIERGWRSVVALSGMRGALSVALAIGLPAATPFRAELIDVVFGVVFLTLVGQGLAIGPVISRLRLASA